MKNAYIYFLLPPVKPGTLTRSGALHCPPVGKFQHYVSADEVILVTQQMKQVYCRSSTHHMYLCILFV